MIAPKPVELVPHDPAWRTLAERETERLVDASEGIISAVHHIGSTAVPGICAKPTIDLMPVANQLTLLDGLRPAFERLGYEWRGENGIPGRRYCVRDDEATGRRLFQLHCFQVGSPHIDRHIAFRDHLCVNEDRALEYQRLKRKCQAQHPRSTWDYSDCKHDWIQRVEAEALSEAFRGRR